MNNVIEIDNIDEILPKNLWKFAIYSKNKEGIVIIHSHIKNLLSMENAIMMAQTVYKLLLARKHITVETVDIKISSYVE